MTLFECVLQFPRAQVDYPAAVRHFYIVERNLKAISACKIIVYTL